MATEPQPSFSRRRKWSIGLDVLARTLVVLAVVIMVNYLSGQYFRRLFLSAQTQIALSSQTISVLKSLTNQVKVTLYYDKEEPLYSTLLALLKEYRNVNPQIQIATVDYQWDAAAAQAAGETEKAELGHCGGSGRLGFQLRSAGRSSRSGLAQVNSILIREG